MKPARDLEATRVFLEKDPVGTAFVIERGFQVAGPREVFVVGKPPRAVLALCHPPWAEGAAGIGLHARKERDADELVRAIPSGPFFAALTEEWMMALLQRRMTSFEGSVFSLFRLDPDDFVDREGHKVQRLDPHWARRVAAGWRPDWDATDYVRDRMEQGPAFAIFELGQPVAWALTHVETPTVCVIGLVHVLETYRRRGFARSVISAAVKDALRRGKVPALHVQIDNDPSVQLMEGLGFRKVKPQVFAEGVIA